MKRWLSLTLLVALTFGFVANASAAQCEGIKFSNHATVGGKKLVLNGLGIREATFLQVDVYVAALYVEHKSKSGNALINPQQTKKLVLHFVRDVDKDDIVDAYNESFKKAAGGKFKAMKPKLKKLLGWMSDIKEGQNQTYDYIPGTGVVVKVKGKTMGTIAGDDFARAFFKIWLGPNPPNSGLKTGLLGGECG